MSKLLIFLLALLSLNNCSNTSGMQKSLDVQGHRGCRGLLPENTIPAFIKATELGVTTIEMDVVLTQDYKVLVSHEPWFSYEISTDPDGNYISDEDDANHNIYRMKYNETKTYDVGLKPHPRFPEQQKMAAQKPLFEDAIEAIEQSLVATGAKPPRYNVEIKFNHVHEGYFYPSPQECAFKTIAAIQQTGFKERFVVQSFSKTILHIVKDIDPEIELAFLVENDETPQESIDYLGFTPAIYSPDFKLVDEQVVAYCKENNMKLIPWTVNEKVDMKRMITLGVDGIITDYPDALIKLVGEMGIQVQ